MELNLDKLEYELFQDKAIQIDLVRRDEHQPIINFHHIRFFQLMEHVEQNNPKENRFFFSREISLME
jgi:hypothetical protein